MNEGMTITREDLLKPRELRFIQKTFDHPSKEEIQEINSRGLFSEDDLKETIFDADRDNGD